MIFDSGYINDAVTSIINKNGFGSGAEAASTIGKLIKKESSPAPSPTVSAAVENVQEKDEKIFGLEKTHAYIAIGAVALIAIFALTRKSS